MAEAVWCGWFGWICLVTMAYAQGGLMLEKVRPPSPTERMKKPEPSSANVVQKNVHEGSTVKFKCPRDPELDEPITWIFMKCDGTLCRNGRKGSETLCGGSGPMCRNSLRLESVNSNHAGIYACYRFKLAPAPGYTQRTVLLAAYQLTINRTTLYKGLELEGPVDHTVVTGKKALLRCKVRTPHPVKLLWFKLVPSTGKMTPKHVIYNNQTYLTLDTGVEEEKDEEESHSKLTIKQTRAGDAGIYVCGLISSTGIKLKQARLIVLTPIPANVSDGHIHFEKSGWEMAMSVGAVVCVLIVTGGWAAICCCLASGGKKVTRKRCTQPINSQRPPAVNFTSDTSEYEQV